MGLQRCTSDLHVRTGLTHAHHVGGNGLCDMGGLGDPTREVLRRRLFLGLDHRIGHAR